jgi:ceramide glucosyltransferase
MIIVSSLLILLLAASLVYCVLTVVAARRYLKVHPPELRGFPPISVLKPLRGFEKDLEDNLRSSFMQDYPNFEIVMAVPGTDDGAIPIVEKLRREFPNIPSRLLITGDSFFQNAKVFSLERLMAEARHGLLVMTDSDVRSGPTMLQRIAAEFQDARIGLATCPYCCIPGQGFWPVLAAIGVNTEFLEGVLVARMLEGMHFALGPAIAARREVIHAIGGFKRLRDYLAEDFMMGKFAAEAGYEVILSSYAVEHRVGTGSFRQAAGQRLRWARSTRRSRPLGYLGQLLTNPIPWALLLWALHPAWWPFATSVALFRTGTAGAVTEWVLHDKLTRRYWWLIPLHDVLGFLLWIAGFFGNTIHWRGRRYRLRSDGTIELTKTE